MIAWLRQFAAGRRSTSPAAASGPASEATPDAVHHSAAVNGFQVLEAALALPVSTWRYHWDPAQVRHLGPMAQDWWDAFGVGENNKTICCTDTNGVAIVCIQALHRLLKESQQETAQLRERLDQLEQRTTQEGTAPTHT
ncbi:tail fiber domain-containing protein [Streptomyces sp. Pv4-95]|uniref:tail fiber domain-containing protein n=1 Tax=Streptomyces sp. Pv4-95 TaxID=3049543 RepID=UPI0038924CAB